MTEHERLLIDRGAAKEPGISGTARGRAVGYTVKAASTEVVERARETVAAR